MNLKLISDSIFHERLPQKTQSDFNLEPINVIVIVSLLDATLL